MIEKWITKIELGESDTNKGALELAMTAIKDWCDYNGYSLDVTHNSFVGGTGREHTNEHRMIFIRKDKKSTYGYKLVIHKYYKVVKTEIIKGILDLEIEHKTFDTKPTYYGRLERRF